MDRWREHETWTQVHEHAAYGTYTQAVEEFLARPPQDWSRVTERLAPLLEEGRHEHAGFIDLAADGVPEVTESHESSEPLSVDPQLLRDLSMRPALVQYHTHPQCGEDERWLPLPSPSDYAANVRNAQRGGCRLHVVVSKLGVFLYTPNELGIARLEGKDGEGAAVLWTYDLRAAYSAACGWTEWTHARHLDVARQPGHTVLHFPSADYEGVAARTSKSRAILDSTTVQRRKVENVRDAYTQMLNLLAERREGRTPEAKTPDGWSRQPTPP